MSGAVRSAQRHLVGFDPHPYQAVGFGGRPSYRQETEVRRLLEVHLGQDHAGMFATPVLDSEGDVIGWTTQIEGPIMHLPEADEIAGARLARQVSDIRTLIARLRASERSEDRGAAALLLAALRVAEADLVFAVGSRPCIAGWGFASNDPDPLEGLAGRFKPVDPPPPDPPPPVRRKVIKRRSRPFGILPRAAFTGIVLAVAVISALLWLWPRERSWHERAGAWEYRGALGAPGRRSALMLGLVFDGHGGAVLNVVTEARPDCRLPLAAEATKEQTVFRPTERLSCAPDVPPAALTLGCGAQKDGRLICDVAWGARNYPDRTFITVREESST